MNRLWLPLSLILAAPVAAEDSVSLSSGLPIAVEPWIIAVPEAGGPGERSCREALGLPPQEAPTRTQAAISVPEPATPTPALPATLTIEGSGEELSIAGLHDPSTLPLQRIEGPPHALEAVRRAMARGPAGRRLRISFFGASHTGGDWWTGHIRRRLQERHGDLGHGFVMPAALYSGYRGQDVNLCRSDGWRSDWAGKRDGRGDGLLGFAGASVSADDPGQFGWIETTRTNPQGRSVGWFDLYTLGQPGGGQLAVAVDDAPARLVGTDHDEPLLQRTRLLVPDGSHRLTLSPGGDGEVRVFGVSMERDGPGVLVDAMGIRGRQARTWLDWDTTLFGQGLASLEPDLVVLAYGTNEAANTKYAMEEYEADLRSVLRKLRAAWPEPQACVLVGPGDRFKKTGRDRYSVWGRTRLVADVQRKVAPEFGCGYWDWQEAMGGAGSMMRFRQNDPPLAAADGIHFTKAGYELMGEHFLSALDALQEGPRYKVAP